MVVKWLLIVVNQNLSNHLKTELLDYIIKHRMKSLALACTAAVTFGLGIQDTSHAPDDVKEKECQTRNKFGCMWPHDMNFRHSDYFV